MPQVDPQSGTLVDTLQSQAASITDLTKTIARGVPALRDAGENVLELNPAANSPLLTSNANDIGLTFDAGLLSVVDKSGQNGRVVVAAAHQTQYSDRPGNAPTQINEGGFQGNAVTADSFVTVGNNAVVADHNGNVTAGGAVTAGQIIGGTLNSSNGIGVSAGTSWFSGDVHTLGVFPTSVHCSGNITTDTLNSNNGAGINGNVFVQGNLTTGTLNSNNGAGINGNVFIQGNTTTGTLNSNNGAGISGDVFITGGCSAGHGSIGGVGLGNNGVFTGTAVMDGAGFGIGGPFGTVVMHWDGIDTAGTKVDAHFGPMYAGAFFTNVCESRLKQDIAPIEESQLDHVMAAPLYHYRYQPGVSDDDAAWRRGPLADDLPAHALGDSDRGKTPDVVAMLYTAWGAIRELSEKVDALTARLAAVEGTS